MSACCPKGRQGKVSWPVRLTKFILLVHNTDVAGFRAFMYILRKVAKQAAPVY